MTTYYYRYFLLKLVFLRRCFVGVAVVACLSTNARADLGDELFKLTASDAAAEDQFGSSVAISGNSAWVGAPGGGENGGLAYRFDMTTGSELAQLTAADFGGSFGSSVAISGNTALVGAPGHNTVPSPVAVFFSGAAYLFDVTAGSQFRKFVAFDAAHGDGFGASVAISGNTALVGAPGDDDSLGSAYLLDVITGNQVAKLYASDGAAGDEFGASVAISGNMVIVGAPFDDDGGNSSGSAYLFDVTTGEELFKLTASDAAFNDQFGRSVAISGNTAIVGAPEDEQVDDAGFGFGAAYLFDVTTGEELFKLTASDREENDDFGTSVAISGNTAIVGAPFEDAAADGSGAAYLFDVTTGNELAKLIASDGDEFDGFGSSVSISGSKAIVVARGDDDAGENSGSAYVFSVVPEPASWVLIALGGWALVVRRRRG